MTKLIGGGPAFLLAMSCAAAMTQDHGHGNPERQKLLGTEIKDFSLTDSTGKAFQLSSLRRTEKNKGTMAVLTFWCTTCVSCREIEKDFNRRAREYKEKGALFLMVDSNAPETVEQVSGFLKKNELSFPVLMDSESEIARYFGATRTTTTAVIDAEGRLRYYGGYGNSVVNAVEDLLVGKGVAVPESQASG